MKRPYEISVVLVRTIYERNIGSTSRAMSNMGARRLILIDKKCELTFDAQQAAATGQEGLQNRVEYKDWEEFFAHEPNGLRLAFTARDGRGRAVRDFQETLEHLKKESPYFQKESEQPIPIYLIFGPEDWGLSAIDLELTHYAASLPTYGENWSLNLSQAVLLALFIIRQSFGGAKTRLDGKQPPRKFFSRESVFPEQTLRTWLQTMQFDLSKKKINVFTVLRRMMLQNTPTTKELRILEIALQQSIRRMKSSAMATPLTATQSTANSPKVDTDE